MGTPWQRIARERERGRVGERSLRMVLAVFALQSSCLVLWCHAGAIKGKGERLARQAGEDAQRAEGALDSLSLSLFLSLSILGQTRLGKTRAAGEMRE